MTLRIRNRHWTSRPITHNGRHAYRSYADICRRGEAYEKTAMARLRREQGAQGNDAFEQFLKAAGHAVRQAVMLPVVHLIQGPPRSKIQPASHN